MRRLSPFVFLAASSLILCTASQDAAAGGRGHGFGAKGVHFGGHRGFRHGAFGHRRHFGFHHGRFHHGRFGFRHGKFGHAVGFGGFWPGSLDNGYGSPPVYVQQNVATSVAAYPTVLDLPGSTGIRSEPAAQPIVYVIRGPQTRHEPPLVRKGSLGRPGAKVVAMNPGREIAATGSGGPSESGPRIIEVAVRRGP
jgi:hypothetical protein